LELLGLVPRLCPFFLPFIAVIFPSSQSKYGIKEGVFWGAILCTRDFGLLLTQIGA